ncbi:MAG: CoA transferase [Alphaproteobacteria bacterium HGW-Alphaproteobacteria-16]|nr:MAG: CoA transferase [Alphaproteobacteria bacterium HGW-Alphaproteobacteria-16]
MTDVLKGFTVLDLGNGQAVSTAGLLLAQSGADVIRLDRDDASLTPVQDALWNRDKTREPFSAARLEALLGQVDAVIHDVLPADAPALGIDAAMLSARYPALIHVAVGGWPAGHPNENRPVSDALVLAEAGLLDEQQAVNRDGPVWLRFPLGSAHAGYLAAIGVLARLYSRRRTGKGGPVSTSLVQGALIPTALLWHRADNPSPAIKFGFPKDAGATLFECGDGLWMHTMGQPVKAPSVATALAAMNPDHRTAFNIRYAGAVIKYIEDRGAIEAIFKTRPRAVWLEELWAADVPVQPVQKIGDLYFDEQAAANAYVVDVEDAHFGKTRQPGPPMQVATGTPDVRPVVEMREMTSPLDGLKVADFGNFLAGPLAPQLLADLGADVVKVESTTGDPLRHADWAFNGCQRNKRDIAVALKHPQAGDVLARLIGWADVVHHNQRMPAAVKLGFGWDAVHAINPRAVYCHVSSYGPVGPRKDWPGYDQLFQAASGWESANAGEGNRPMWCRFGMMDHLCALASVVATLLAVLRRDATGTGEFVAASLLGGSLATMETFVLPDGRLAPIATLDRNQLGIGPTQRLFACADGWIAVDAPGSDTMPDGLGEDDLAAMTQVAAVEALAAQNYPAVAVVLNNGAAFLADPNNRAARLVASFEHPTYGGYDQVGMAWNFGDLVTPLDRPPPLLGEHSDAVLAELGFDDDARAALFAAEVVKAA